MNPQPFPVRTLRLAARQAATAVVARGARLTVDRGCVWLTRERDERDFVLRAGSSFVSDGDDVLVVQMLTSGTLAIGAADVRPPAVADRLRALLRQLRSRLSPAVMPACQF